MAAELLCCEQYVGASEKMSDILLYDGRTNGSSQAEEKIVG